MISLFKLVLLGAVIYAGYWYYQNVYHAPVVEAQAEPSPSLPTSVTCPTCEGEGRLSYVDLQGRNHRYPCGVCGFRGARILGPLPTGAHVCPDCQGMGRYAVRVARRNVRGGHLLESERCQRCAGQGMILPRAQPGRQTPTHPINPIRSR